MRIVLAACFALLAACPALGEDLFIGVFESETRENFGSDTPGEYRIEVVAAPNDKYEATFYRRGEIFEKQELVRCPEERLDYFRGRAPGRAEVLCFDMGYGTLFGQFAYSENGIQVPAIKSKYIKNPELIKQEGLKPGDLSLFEARHHKTKYYAHVHCCFYGFRKISP